MILKTKTGRGFSFTFYSGQTFSLDVTKPQFMIITMMIEYILIVNGM